jgi:hypothetical protein
MTDIEKLGDRQRPNLFPEVILVYDGDGVRFFHVAAELGEDLRKRDADADSE